jgi:hypothetical protein
MVAVLTVQGFVRSHGDWAGALGGFIAGMLLWGICKLAMSVYHAISRRMAARK